MAQKLSIQGYKDEKFSSKNGEPFVVMVNPEKYNHSYSISLKDQKNAGNAATVSVFDSVGPETVSFSFLLDDTGAVPRNQENEGKKVAQMVKALKDVVYKYYGETHQTNFVLLKWGTLLFKSRLTDLKIDYKMFKPNGVPLRAEVNVTFKGFMDPAQESQIANRNSPDLTHLVTVQEGDNLPGLCNRIYKDKKYYLAVARVNNLIDVRHLEVGSTLIFPPLN